MQQRVLERALEKGGLMPKDLDYVLAGDLLNQCIGTSFGLRSFHIPFYGLYGACSTMAESLCLAGMFVDTKLASRCLAVTSSHFCSAERQFRFPLEYGGQRTPTAQWTVTGSGACIVAGKDRPPYLRAATVGTVEDLGITGLVIDDEGDFRDFLEHNRAYWDYVDDALMQEKKGLCRITFYLEDSPDGYNTLSRVRMALSRVKQEHPEYGSLLLTMENMEDADWENNWKLSLIHI